MSNDPTTSNAPCIVSANQVEVVHQLQVNGICTMHQANASCTTHSNIRICSMVYPFSEEEHRKRVVILKTRKTAGRADVLVYQQNKLIPKAHRWLLTMLNKCSMENKTLWRQSKIIAILKPGKDTVIPKSYRPISLLCHTYTLYEIMILNRIAPTIEEYLIKDRPVSDLVSHVHANC